MGGYQCYRIFLFLILLSLALITGVFANSIFGLEGCGQYVLWYLIFILYSIFAYILVIRGRIWFPYAIITKINNTDEIKIFCYGAVGKKVYKLAKKDNAKKYKPQLKIEFPQKTRYTIYYRINDAVKLEKIFVDFYSENTPHIELPPQKDDDKQK